MTNVVQCPPVRAPLGLLPPRWGWLLLGAGAAGHGALVASRAAPAWHEPWLGALVALAGLAIAVRSKSRFRADHTPLSPSASPERLYTDGLYALTRNPMYLGITLVLLGAGLALWTWPPLLAAPLYVWIIGRWFVPMEEHALERRFGEEWRCYRARVPRWL